MIVSLSILVFCLILSHFILWFLLYNMAKLIDKRFDYLSSSLGNHSDSFRVVLFNQSLLSDSFDSLSVLLSQKVADCTKD